MGLKPPLGPFFRSPRFRFLRPLCSSPLGPYWSQHCGHIWPIVHFPQMIHEGDCGVIGGANDDCRGNRRTRRKPAPAPLCPTTKSRTYSVCLMSLILHAKSHKGMVRSDMSKPALIFFSTARVHTTKYTVKILAANTQCKYFLKIAELTHFFCTRNRLYQRFVQPS
jgi:hypothetical protein